MPSRRIAEDGSLSETERRLLKGLYTSGPSAYGSVASLVKSSGLSRKKVLEFLHSSNAYTQYHIAYRKFPRLYVVAKSVNEIWCADLAQMDKLASHNDGVNFFTDISGYPLTICSGSTNEEQDCPIYKNGFHEDD